MVYLCSNASIHALHAESDMQVYVNFKNALWLQFTLSMRRATEFQTAFYKSYICFNSRSPCGERPDLEDIMPCDLTASIHALHAESDIWKRCCYRGDKMLQFTLSMRRATLNPNVSAISCCASIHALHAESDFLKHKTPSPNSDASIHALHAESDIAAFIFWISERYASIHALHAESDESHWYM